MNFEQPNINESDKEEKLNQEIDQEVVNFEESSVKAKKALDSRVIDKVKEIGEVVYKRTEKKTGDGIIHSVGKNQAYEDHKREMKGTKF